MFVNAKIQIKKNMKKSILFFAGLLIAFASTAQQYKKMGYLNSVFENNEVKITADDPVSTEKFLKVKLRIKNKTNDYMVLDASKCIFKVNGKEHKTEEKILLISPNDDDFRVVDLKGTDLMVETFQLVVAGLSRFPADAKGIDAPDFKLPPSVNNFTAGPFKVNMVKLFKETQRTDAKFKALYAGEKIGIFEPSQVSMRMPDGKEFANYKSDKKALIFLQGDEATFTTTWLNDGMLKSGDMQVVDMMIMWRSAFKEVTPVPMESQTLEIKFSPGLSK
jgi:hypothetical protein